MKIVSRLFMAAAILTIAIEAGGNSGKAVFSPMLPEKEERKEAILDPADYTVKINLAPMIEKRKVVSESLDLEWDKSPLAATSSDGWVANDGNYLWRPEVANDSINIPLMLKRAEKDTRITDFDEILVEYQELFPENPSQLSMGITLSGAKSPADSFFKKQNQGRFLLAKQEEPSDVDEKRRRKENQGRVKRYSKEKALRAPQGKILNIIHSLSLSQASWAIKDNWYVFRRILRLPPDLLWRYKQQGEDAFLQQRLFEDLASVEAMDLVFKKDTLPLKINPWNLRVKVGADPFGCNLRIGFGNRLKQPEVMPCGGSTALSLTQDLERQVLRVEMGDLVRDLNEKGNKRVILEEIILHFPGKNARQLMENPPVEEIFFQKWDERQKKEWLKALSDEREKNKREERLKVEVEQWVNEVQAKNQSKQLPLFTLDAKTASLDGQKKRFVLNLRGLADYMGKKTSMHGMKLSIRPRFAEAPSGVRLHRIRMIKQAEQQRPSVLKLEEPLVSRWGGPFWNLMDIGKNLEWLNVDAYFPFEKKGWKSAEKNATAVRVGSATIRSDNPLSTGTAPDNGLEIEGQGKWVEIDWPVGVQANGQTHFYLDVPKGINSIARMQVKPYGSGAVFPSVQAFPNEPIKLGSGNMDGLKILMELNGDPFQLILKEMVLFRPELIPLVDTINASRPVWEATPLVPENIRVSTGNDIQIVSNRLTGNISDKAAGSLSWSTVVGRKVDWIRGIKLQYGKALPIADPCQLHLVLNISGRHIERTVCAQENNGEAYIPASDLFHGLEIKSDDVLRVIDWKVYLTGPGQADLAIALDGINMRSIRDELTMHPVMRWDKQKFFPVSITTMPPKKLIEDNYWVNLGLLKVREDSAEGPLDFQEHPYLASQKVVFEKSETLGDTIISMAPGQVNVKVLPDADSKAPFRAQPWFKVLSVVSIFMIFRWIWNRGYAKRWWEVCVMRAVEFSYYSTEARSMCSSKIAFIIRRSRATARVYATREASIIKRNRDDSELYLAILPLIKMANRILGLMLVGFYFWTMSTIDDVDIRNPILYALSLFLLIVLRHEWSCRLQYQNFSPTRGIGIFCGKINEIPYGLRFVVILLAGWITWQIGIGGDILRKIALPLELASYLYLPWVLAKLWKYHYLPRCFYYWLWRGYYHLWERYYWLWERYYRLWVFIAVGFYLASLLVSGVHLRSYFAVTGSLCMILAWRSWILFFRSHLEGRWPVLAGKIFCGEGTHYISGFLLFTLMGIISRSIKLQTVAEQFAVAGFAMLAIGVIAEILASRKKRQKGYDPLMAEEAPCA